MSAPLLAAVLLLQAAPAAPSTPVETLRVRSVAHAPAAGGSLDTLSWGVPQVSIGTGQGTASIWLLRAADTVFVVATIPDTTRSWSDELAVCFDAAGDRAAAPAHDDFQWALRRALDSSVVYRGRAGRWEPPRNDPDWRLGAELAGGGWEVDGTDGPVGWTVTLRLDPAWLAGEREQRPRIGFRLHDNDPNRWYVWPAPTTGAGAMMLDRTPALWVPLE